MKVLKMKLLRQCEKQPLFYFLLLTDMFNQRCMDAKCGFRLSTILQWMSRSQQDESMSECGLRIHMDRYSNNRTNGI